MKKVKSWITPIAVAVLIAINGVVLGQLSNTHDKYVEQQTMTVETKASLNQMSQDKDKLTKEKESIETSFKEQQKKSESLEGENQTLKANLQAKKEAQARAVQTAVKPKSAASVPVTGNCAIWLAQAGVTDTQTAMILINRESGCNPNAVNPSSGACGVGQELPCGKSGCNLGDGACQTAWMNRYVLGRYGSWPNALAHSNSVGWY